MILDKRNEFADGTAVNTGAAGTYLLGNQIDLGAAQRDIGSGEPVYLVITAAEAITAGAGGTLDFTLASDAQAAIAVDGSATVHFKTGPIAATSIPAGTVLAAVAVPMEGKAYERYLGVLQTTATAAATAGKIDAFLTLDVSSGKPTTRLATCKE